MPMPLRPGKLVLAAVSQMLLLGCFHVACSDSSGSQACFEGACDPGTCSMDGGAHCECPAGYAPGEGLTCIPGSGSGNIRVEYVGPGEPLDDITDYRLCVTAEDMEDRCESFSVLEHPHGATIEGLPPGQNRTVTFVGYDQPAGDARWSGKALGVEVEASSTTMVEIYITVCSDFTAVRNEMETRRVFHTATRLSNGKVLVAGGFTDLSRAGDRYTLTATSSVEIYDPRSGEFSASGLGLGRARALHTTALIPDPGGDPEADKVLIAGGSSSACWVADFPHGIRPVVSVEGSGGDLSTSTADLIDMRSRTVSEIVLTPSSARVQHSAWDLGNGEVAILGGIAPATDEPLATIGLYSQEREDFRNAGLDLYAARQGMTVVPFGQASVLVWGGNHSDGSMPGTFAEILTERQDGLFSRIPNFVGIGDPAFYSAGVAMDDVKVLICGGMLIDPEYRPYAVQPEILDRVYLLDLTANLETIDTIPEGMVYPRAFHTAAALFDEGSHEAREVLVAGGIMRYDILGSQWVPVEAVEFYSIEEGVFERKQIHGSEVELSEARAAHTLTRLDDGSLLLCGGFTLDIVGLAISATAEIFNPRSRDTLGQSD
ncbi:MAG: hypothetical protein JXR96_25840 [Deltaproteobacteria bacterium]|nr:hypothetical protein [Deltaproteobacteria bacterium]